jgi:hypothetical protein
MYSPRSGCLAPSKSRRVRAGGLLPGVTSLTPPVRMFLVPGARDPEQALANDPYQDADCDGLIGVNVYGSGARLVITVAH